MIHVKILSKLILYTEYLFMGMISMKTCVASYRSAAVIAVTEILHYDESIARGGYGGQNTYMNSKINK